MTDRRWCERCHGSGHAPDCVCDSALAFVLGCCPECHGEGFVSVKLDDTKQRGRARRARGVGQMAIVRCAETAGADVDGRGFLLCAASGKRRHASELQAKAARSDLYRSPHFHEEPAPVHVYHCEACGDWHVGHRRGEPLP